MTPYLGAGSLCFQHHGGRDCSPEQLAQVRKDAVSNGFGEFADKDTGLVHFGYREYDPRIGRFITPDPIGFAGGDVDVYGYCLDDPMGYNGGASPFPSNLPLTITLQIEHII